MKKKNRQNSLKNCQHQTYFIKCQPAKKLLPWSTKQKNIPTPIFHPQNLLFIFFLVMKFFFLKFVKPENADIFENETHTQSSVRLRLKLYLSPSHWFKFSYFFKLYFEIQKNTQIHSFQFYHRSIEKYSCSIIYANRKRI